MINRYIKKIKNTFFENSFFWKKIKILKKEKIKNKCIANLYTGENISQNAKLKKNKSSMIKIILKFNLLISMFERKNIKYNKMGTTMVKTCSANSTKFLFNQKATQLKLLRYSSGE